MSDRGLAPPPDGGYRAGLAVSLLFAALAAAPLPTTPASRFDQARIKEASRCGQDRALGLALHREPPSRWERAPEVHAVGDRTGLGLIQKATLEGARAACAL
jgi:hypothetical protein